MRHYTRLELNARTTKGYDGLLEIAKELKIVGRHDMTKVDLIEAILQKQPKPESLERAIISEEIDQHLNKDKYINEAEVGQFVAFKTQSGVKNKCISAKITKVIKGVGAYANLVIALNVEAKDGREFTVNKNDIVWVKTGDRWPKGVYNLLKGIEKVIL